MIRAGILHQTTEARRRARSYGSVLVLVGIGALLALAWIVVHGIGWIETTGFLLFYLLSSIGQGIGLHRYFSHRSFRTSRTGRQILAILSVMSMQGPIIGWVADHRRHHAHTDRCGDLHSPAIDTQCGALEGWSGLWHAQLGWVFSGSYSDPRIFAADLVDDPFLQGLDDRRLLWYALSILLLPALYGYVAGGANHVIPSMLVAGFLRAFVFSQSILALNSIGHTIGRQRFHQSNGSRNNAVIALFTLGEGWHNNHHRFPRSASNRIAWYELDPLGLIVGIGERLGIFWDVHKTGGGRSRPSALWDATSVKKPDV